jgi:putative transposase
MMKGYKYRIYPNKKQTELLNQMLGNARFVYNWALNRRIEAYQKDKKKLSAFTLMKELAKLKKKEEYEWLNLSVAQSLQASIVNMEKAFTRFFKQKKGFPNFKSKKRGKQTISFPQNTKIDFENNKISVNKLLWIKSRISRRFDGTIKTAVISKTPTNKFFISLTVEQKDIKVKQKPIREKTAVGVDVGIKTFATLSDGREIENPKHLKSSLQRLKILQRRASKKQKGSANRRKAFLRVARLHEKISNQRMDFIHKTTTQIVNEWDTVIVENLNVAGMLKNHHLAQSIADLGLGAFYRILNYKLVEQGKNYLEIGRFEPSSKLCECGELNNNLKLSDREWTCEHCGTTHQRDLLAAKNIKKFGLQKQNLSTVGMTGSVC